MLPASTLGKERTPDVFSSHTDSDPGTLDSLAGIASIKTGQSVWMPHQVKAGGNVYILHRSKQNAVTMV